MNTTLPTPDPAALVAEIRHIIELYDVETPTCEQTLLAIRRVVFPPPAEPLREPGGWPTMHASDYPGTAWERHDDPTINNRREGGI